MLFSVLLAQLLLASTVFALPTSKARFERRLANRKANQRTLPLQRATNGTASACTGRCDDQNVLQYSDNWSGAVLNKGAVRGPCRGHATTEYGAYVYFMQGTFQYVTASFVVPVPSNPPGTVDGACAASA
jgi:uncharacterized protein (DUF58 family)